MKSSEKLLSARILSFAIATSFFVLGIVVYTHYAEEIEKEVTEAIASALPEVDNTVAQR